MKVIAALMVVLCAGCASHTKVRVEANSGTSNSSSFVEVRSHSGSDVFTLLGLTIVAATIVEMERAHLGQLWRRDAPPLAPDRVITEHDCRIPIESITGNLRCK